jgi:heme-degrading monooxygenase HmoA
MAIGLIFDGDGVTQSQYEQVLHAVMSEGEQVKGFLSHAAGPREGGFCVVETWESQEALQRFIDQKLGRALAEAGITTQPRLFQITNQVP